MLSSKYYPPSQPQRRRNRSYAFQKRIGSRYTRGIVVVAGGVFAGLAVAGVFKGSNGPAPGAGSGRVTINIGE